MRNTPVTWPRAELSGSASTVRRRFALRMGGNEIALSRGELLMGRSRSCQVIVDDMLVSRHHARLLVSHNALFVEDLGSTNGVIVNEAPIAGPTPLADGDRVIVGTQEMVIRAVDDGVETLPPPSPRATQTTPKAQPSVQLAAIKPTSPEIPAMRAMPAAHPGLEGADTTQRTEKADGLATMARMADRMITMGRHDAAARLLGDHLKGLLTKARQGRPVPKDALETAGLYGLKLTEVTRDATWANIAVELHLIARRPLPEKAVALLELVLTKVEGVDRQLILALKAALRDAADGLARDEWALVERILRIHIR